MTRSRGRRCSSTPDNAGDRSDSPRDVAADGGGGGAAGDCTAGRVGAGGDGVRSSSPNDDSTADDSPIPKDSTAAEFRPSRRTRTDEPKTAH